MFRVYFREKAFKTLARIDRKSQLKINTVLDELRLGNFRGKDLDKIRSTEVGYRLRIGRWRILFVLLQKEKRIEIIDIFLKKGREDYRKRKGLVH